VLLKPERSQWAGRHELFERERESDPDLTTGINAPSYARSNITTTCEVLETSSAADTGAILIHQGD
jgi:hypothetical protein